MSADGTGSLHAVRTGTACTKTELSKTLKTFNEHHHRVLVETKEPSGIPSRSAAVLQKEWIETKNPHTSHE